MLSWRSASSIQGQPRRGPRELRERHGLHELRGWRGLRGLGDLRGLRDLRFAAGLLRRRPFSLLLQVTNRCTLRCRFCSFHRHPADPRDELTLDDYARLAGELARVGCFLVSIEGGEPLLRDDIVEIVRALSRQHLTTLYTNGQLMTGRLAGQLFAAGLNQAGVSIDYPDAEQHDAHRGGGAGTCARAWRAVELLRQAAPRGGRQVHVMTVLMRSNQQRLRRLLEQSASAGVGHSLTLLSTQGSRRDPELQNELPAPPLAAPLCDLWREFPHLRVFSDYLRLCERFVAGQPMPACPAGRQGFNIDHLGNLSHCIERIGQSVGNLRHEPLSAVLTRLRPADVAGCQDCLSLCRGFLQALGDGSSWRALAELGGRLRS